MPTAAPTKAAHRHDANPLGLTPEAPHLACEATPAQQSWALRDGQQHQVAVALEILHTAHVRWPGKTLLLSRSGMLCAARKRHSRNQ